LSRLLRAGSLALCLLAVPMMAADIYDFSVTPPVTVSSAAGAQSGWGYSLINESSSLWLVTTGLSSGTFQYATPNVIFDFPDLAPGATVNMPYDPITPSGLLEIAWDNAVPPGFVNSGNFTLNAEWWSGDPLNGGAFVSSAPTAIAPYSVGLNAVPEPATAGLVGLLLLAVLRWRDEKLFRIG
jgi:hypothetical protein